MALDPAALGFDLPVGTDFISAGDDAITKNAQATAALFDARSYERGRIPNGSDVLTLASGSWTVSSAGFAETMTNLPELYPGRLIIDNGGEPIVKAATFKPYNRDYHYETTRNASGGWMPWRKVQTLHPTHAPHTIREAQMVHHYGRVDTGRRGAVAWRIDHGLSNFKTKLLPIFRAAGIVPMITLNSRSWDNPENAGVTQSEVNQWVADGWVEISNHGTVHSNVTGTAAIDEYVGTGLAELEAQLPAAKGRIFGFHIAGVGVTGAFDGFQGGSTPEQWDTAMGRAILRYHAFGSGYVPGTELRVLDGQIRQGLNHMGTDTRPVSDITTKIDEAISARRGFQIMSHPSNLDTTGNHTTAMIQQIVDYIVTKRSAGQLVVLSPYQLMLADAGAPEFDSGVRNINSLMPTAPTSGRLLLQRIGRTVWYSLDELVLGTVGASFTNLATLPVGYRPAMSSVDWPTSPRLASDNDVDKAAGIRVATGGNSYIYQAEAGRAYRCIGSFPTNDPLPNATVGSAA